ncbi:L-type lectin-domain containing receptor kinase VI.2 isoform X2 [Physcomitrium patens]|uniref:non-specific serine/threonine protein kinase n=1 Tax=Physcomitrium patens TaxID=3218 RepID=A0A2K1KP50_PHYPA|nr:L-type lectin-domain containing receptor kinase VI.2-like isoform X2 [Physcomitrium patens]XP_024372766.1 L-type lectin-domain containing receptor kinase VI.2-like isoform X2 [Physcomitrium patens]PNR55531.1 hypothetical protein PHYPA_006428 [Physcomitrium patens]|eukprot:XP_024372765.1 L-type lectin-domain containing receptor kinase VI.2-like isoform X2 [Physcomitrella patens]
MAPESQLGGPSRSFTLLLLVSVIAVSYGEASTHIVGGDRKWDFPPNSSSSSWYDDWANNNTFRVGDQLVFNYTSGLHNVAELATGNDYDMCNLSAIITTFGSGVDVVTLDRPGWHYYVCAVLGHCATRYLKVKIYVNASDAGSASISSSVGAPGGGSNLSAIVGAIIGTVVVMLVAAGAVWYNRRRKRFSSLHGSRRSGLTARKSPLIPFESLGADGPRVFTFKELAAATKNFSRTELLGRGGFGSVYKGVLRDKSMVAVKSIAKDSRQGEIEFLAEVSIIGKIRHRNLVRLRGWCAEKEKLLVVYDYMPNGSLDKWIMPAEEGETNPVLAWNARYNILSGLSGALAYLHEEWQQCILHRDVKPSNILLDDKFNAYLGDFGMARLIDHNKVAYSTVVAGTMGYLAPELPHTRKATPKTDVFSFGVLALEVTCGRRAFDPNRPHAEVYLLDWVWTMHQNNQLRKCVDPRLGEDVDVMQSRLVLHIALLACHPDPASRPSMRFVRQVLYGDLSLPTIPPSRPVISYSWSSTIQPTQECISIEVQHPENTDESVRKPDNSPAA